MSRLLSSPAFLFGLELFLKSSLVLLLGLALSAALRRRSAALRHFLLTVFLVGLLALPFLSRMPGGWKLRILPAARVAAKPVPLPAASTLGLEFPVRRAVITEPDLVALTPEAAESPKAPPIRTSLHLIAALGKYLNIIANSPVITRKDTMKYKIWRIAVIPGTIFER